MTIDDPKLLAADEGATDFERRWLSAARAEDLPRDVASRIEQALGLGTAAPVVPAAPVAVTAAVKSSVWALRIAGLSALGVTGAVGVVLLLSRAPTPSVEAPPRATATATAKATASVTSAPANEQPAGATGNLPDEIAMIDGARRALASGSPARALSLLDRYRARHPQGMLLPEALAMRIDAIDRSGDHSRAETLAREFLQQYPNSPLAQRVAQIRRASSRGDRAAP